MPALVFNRHRPQAALGRNNFPSILNPREPFHERGVVFIQTFHFSKQVSQGNPPPVGFSQHEFDS
jgi:hypothetical protein